METTMVLGRRVIAALKGSAALKKYGVCVFETPPFDARTPYLVTGPVTVLDWGWKGGGGEDVRFVITLWDACERHDDAKAILAGVERAILDMPRSGGGIRIVNLRRTRSELRRRPKQRTEGSVAFRALIVGEK